MTTRWETSQSVWTSTVSEPGQYRRNQGLMAIDGGYLKAFVAAWSNYQAHRRQRAEQEEEYTQVAGDQYVQQFQCWGMNLIRILPKTRNGNRWIITAVVYTTGWAIAMASTETTEKVVAEFLFAEIHMYFEAPQEILTDGKKNLSAIVSSEDCNSLLQHERL